MTNINDDLTTLLETEINYIFMNDYYSSRIVIYKGGKITLTLEPDGFETHLQLFVNDKMVYQYLISGAKGLDIAVTKIEKLLGEI